MLALITVPVLLILPGCWVAFAFSEHRLSFSARISLAVVLTPVVAGVQMYAARALGLSTASAFWLVVINLPALALVARAWRARPKETSDSWVPGAAVFAAVAICLTIPWLLEPDFRRFSWHGLFHTDIIYAIARGGLIPEEPELAGVTLAYPWFGHVYWLLLSAVSNLAPTLLYAVTNISLAGAVGVLYVKLARELGASEQGALLAPVVLALGISWTGVIGWSLMPPNDSGVWWALLGDLRHSPFLQKFSAFEVMNFGFACFVALAYVSVMAVRTQLGYALLLLPILLASIGALYPLLLPPAALLVAAALAACLLEWRRSGAQWHAAPLVTTIFASIAALVIGALCLKLFSLGRAGSLATISPPAAFAKKAIALMLSCAPFAVAGYALWRKEATMRTALAILAITAIGSVLANLVLRLGSLTEYKYVFTAGVCLVAPAIAGLERTVLLTQRGRVRMLVAAIAVLALVMVAYTRDQIPRNTSAPLAVRENSFWLRLAEREPEAGWTDAVRKQTPTSAVLVVNHPDFHTSAFTGRSLLVPTEKDRPHFGYSLNTESNMVRIRGYDSELVKRRLQLLAALYATPAADGDALLRELRSLGRPIVLVYRPGDARGFADWMRARGIGQIVYEADPYLVYMVEP